jgi:hypothetical protein
MKHSKLAELIMSDYSKAHVLVVANEACTSANNFKELLNCFLSSDKELSKRAAWSLSWAARQKPEMVYPHIKELVSVLDKKDLHPAILRNAVRVLEEVEIPEVYHGEVMNACFNFIEKPDTAIAVKAFSLTVLYKLAKIYPEISHELKLIIEENWDNETPAFRSRGKKILSMLSKTK